MITLVDDNALFTAVLLAAIAYLVIRILPKLLLGLALVVAAVLVLDQAAAHLPTLPDSARDTVEEPTPSPLIPAPGPAPDECNPDDCDDVVYLYRVGKAPENGIARPGDPRRDHDRLTVDDRGHVGPELVPHDTGNWFHAGMSTFLDPEIAKTVLKSARHLYRVPYDDVVATDGLGVEQDDTLAGGDPFVGHRVVYPTRDMHLDDLTTRWNSLQWEYLGRGW